MTCRSDIVSNSFPEVNTRRCRSHLGCPEGVCPDFVIRRHDTRPSLRVNIEDCDGPLELEGLVVEFSMWAKGRLKYDMDTSSNFLAFADKIGFDQVMVDDILILDRARNPEHMKAVGFDEENFLVFVQRGANGTTIGSWKKGTGVRIMKEFSSPAISEVVLQDIENRDGTKDRNQLTDSFLVYDWNASDTCLAGCYWGEFKLLKLVSEQTDPPAEEQGTTLTITPSDYGCNLGTGVEWARRFPLLGEGYLILVTDSPTAEL